MITLDSSDKYAIIEVTTQAFHLENGVVTLQIDPDEYAITGRDIYAVFGETGVTTGFLSVVDGIIQLPITQGLVVYGYNNFQLHAQVHGTTTVEDFNKMRWLVEPSIIGTIPAPTDVDIIIDLIAQVTALNGVATTKAAEAADSAAAALASEEAAALSEQHAAESLLQISGIDNIVWIGDSYVQASSLGESQSSRFSTLVSSWLGLTERNYAIGGMGFVYGATPFLTQLNTAIADTSFDNDKVKYVVVCGGRNDASNYPNYTQSQMNSAVAPVIDAANNNFPNAKVIIVPMLWDSTYVTASAYKWYSGIINTASFRRTVIIRTAYTWLTGSFGYILEDGVHPTVTGHTVIANCIFQQINGFPSTHKPAYSTAARNTSLIYAGGWFTLSLYEDILWLNTWFKLANNAAAGDTLFTSTYATNNIEAYQGSETQTFPIYLMGSTYPSAFITVSTTYTPTSYTTTVKAATAINASATGYQGQYQFRFALPFNAVGAS